MPGLVQDGWMSAPEAARRLGLQLHTLHKMIDRGELAADVVPLDQVRRRRAIRIRRQDVDDFLITFPGPVVQRSLPACRGSRRRNSWPGSATLRRERR